MRNEFDRLWVNNFSDVMGTSYWLWPLPIKHEMDGRGLYYPHIPEFDMADLHSIAKNKNVEQTFEINESRESVHRYVSTAMHKYKHKKLVADDKIMEIPEDHPDMPSAAEMNNYEDSD